VVHRDKARGQVPSAFGASVCGMAVKGCNGVGEVGISPEHGTLDGPKGVLMGALIHPRCCEVFRERRRSRQ